MSDKILVHSKSGVSYMTKKQIDDQQATILHALGYKLKPREEWISTVSDEPKQSTSTPILSKVSHVAVKVPEELRSSVLDLLSELFDDDDEE